jgi:uncharacterized protein YjbJ (UPF0337 family)
MATVRRHVLGYTLSFPGMRHRSCTHIENRQGEVLPGGTIKELETLLPRRKGSIMGTEDKMAGKAKQVKGKANEIAGAAKGDTGQEIKGKIQKGVGKAQEAMGKATEKK